LRVFDFDAKRRRPDVSYVGDADIALCAASGGNGSAPSIATLDNNDGFETVIDLFTG
jgi:hypothetical protein